MRTPFSFLSRTTLSITPIPLAIRFLDKNGWSDYNRPVGERFAFEHKERTEMSKTLGMRWLVVAVSAAMLLAVAAACSSETIEVPGETVVVKEEVIKTVEVPGETVVKEVVKEVMVPGETVVVKEEVIKTVEVPGETVVVEKVVTQTVQVPGETVTVEVVKTVEVPGETVVVEKVVTQTVQVPGETVVVEKEVVKTVEVPGQTVVVEKEVIKTVEVPGPERVVVKEVPAGYVIDPSTGKVVQKPRYGGVLDIPMTSDPIAFDNWRHKDGGAEGYIFGLMYEVLMGADWATPRDKAPFLASYTPLIYYKGYAMESFTSPDPLTYTFKLRKGMQFHDKEPVNGREVIAEDVKWSIDRILGLGDFAGNPSPHVQYKEGWEALESIELVDKYTFTFHMSEAKPLFPEAWGASIMPMIQPREVVEKYGDDFSWEHAVGSGPFQVQNVVPGSVVTYESNPNYYGTDERYPDNRLPYVDRFNYILVKDEATRMAGLRTGKLAWYAFGYLQTQDLLKTAPHLKWNKWPGACVMAGVRWDKEPWSDIRVRKAMQMALNLPEMNDALYGGDAGVFPMMLHSQLNMNPPLEEWPAETLEGFKYNPEGAMALLTEAGHPDGFTQEVIFGKGEHSFYKNGLDAMISYWDAIGIKTDVKILEGAAYNSYRDALNHDMWITVYCLPWNPITVFNWVYGGKESSRSNHANVDDPVFNKMVDALQAEPDPAVRLDMIVDINAYGTDQFYNIHGPETVQYNLWQPWLQGYNGERKEDAWDSGRRWARVWIDQEMRDAMGH